MNKDEFKKYRGLPQERAYLIRKIQTLERREADVQIVSVKVQASEKDYPYTLSHLTVEAPEPVKSTVIKREIIRCRSRLAKVEHDLDELTQILSRVEDARTRQILTARYVDGDRLKDVAAKYDITEQGILKIINAAVKKLQAV